MEVHATQLRAQQPIVSRYVCMIPGCILSSSACWFPLRHIHFVLAPHQTHPRPCRTSRTGHLQLHLAVHICFNPDLHQRCHSIEVILHRDNSRSKMTAMRVKFLEGNGSCATRSVSHISAMRKNTNPSYDAMRRDCWQAPRENRKSPEGNQCMLAVLGWACR